MPEKPTYEELERQVRRLEASRRILDHSLDLICVTGMDGYFKYVNPAWELVLGYTRDQLLAQPVLTFIHPDDHARSEREVARLANGHLSLDFKNRYLHRNGSIRVVSWRATSLPGERIMYCIGREIGERKRSSPPSEPK